MKFKCGDKIIPLKKHQGFVSAEVIDIIKHNGNEYYKIRLAHSIAIINTTAEELYKLETD